MNNTVPTDNCLTYEQIVRYMRDETTPTETRAIDRHIEKCPLCSDAMEGVMAIGFDAYIADMHRISTKLETENIKAAIETQPLKVSHKNPRRFWLIGAAASVAALVTAGVWFNSQDKKAEKTGDIAVQEVMMDNATTATIPPPYSDSISANLTTTTAPVAAAPIISKDTKQSNATIASVEARSAKQTAPPAEYSLSRAKEDVAVTNEDKETERTIAAPRIVAVPQASEPIRADTYQTAYSQAAALETAREEMPKSEVDKRQKEGVAYMPASGYSKTSDSYQGAANQMPAQKQEATALSKAKMSAKKDRAVTAAAPSKEKSNAIDYNSKETQLNKAAEDLSVGIEQYDYKKYSEAITTFNGILSVVSKGNLYENAQWYLANCYNESGNKAAAKSLFQQIVREKGSFAKMAAKELGIRN
jgi:hypothetical protein